MGSPVERESAWTKDDFRVVLYTTRIRDKEKRECGAMTVTGLQNATAKLDDGKHLQQCDECTQHLDRRSRASHLIAFEPLWSPLFRRGLASLQKDAVSLQCPLLAHVLRQ